MKKLNFLNLFLPQHQKALQTLSRGMNGFSGLSVRGFASKIREKPRALARGGSPIFLVMAGAFFLTGCGEKEITQEPVDTPKQTTTVAIPAGWENYTNQKHSLAFAYPGDWKFKVNMDEEDFLSVSLSKDDNEQAPIEVYGEEMIPGYSINVAVAANPEGLSAREFHLRQFEELSRVAEEARIETVSYGGIEGIKYTEGAASASGPAIAVMLATEGRIYTFTYMAMATQETHEKFLGVLEGILGTAVFE